MYYIIDNFLNDKIWCDEVTLFKIIKKILLPNTGNVSKFMFSPAPVIARCGQPAAMVCKEQHQHYNRHINSQNSASVGDPLSSTTGFHHSPTEYHPSLEVNWAGSTWLSPVQGSLTHAWCAVGVGHAPPPGTLARHWPPATTGRQPRLWCAPGRDRYSGWFAAPLPHSTLPGEKQDGARKTK